MSKSRTTIRVKVNHLNSVEPRRRNVKLLLGLPGLVVSVHNLACLALVSRPVLYTEPTTSLTSTRSGLQETKDEMRRSREPAVQEVHCEW